MTPMTVEFKNYKLLKDQKFEFPQEGNLIFVTGSNNQGKTSFITAWMDMLKAKNSTPNPVSLGEKEGEVVYEIEDKHGEPFIAKFEFTATTAKFTLVTPDGIATKKPMDIRNFFQYHSYTGEEFVKMGNNEKDRKKQRDIFLNLMDPQHVTEFKETEERLNSEFAKRTEVGRNLKALEGALSTAISEEDKELLSKKDALKTEKKNLQIKADKASEIHQLKQQLEFAKLNADQKVQEYANEMKRLEEEHNRIEKLYDLEVSNAIGINDQLLNLPVIEMNPIRLSEIDALIERINEVAGKAIAAEQSSKLLDTTKEEHERLDLNVSGLRQKCIDILVAHAPKIPNITVHSDGLYYKKGDLEVPFDEKNVGTAEIYKITIGILMALNKKTPIIFMGRAESLDNTAINEIAKMAEEMNAKVVFDRVLPNESNIQLIGVEDFEQTLKDNINA